MDPDQLASAGPPVFALCKSQSLKGAQWLSGRVLDLRPRGSRFEPHRRQSLCCGP